MIHGLDSDYTIAEGELREGDYETDVSDDEEEDERNEDDKVGNNIYLIHRQTYMMTNTVTVDCCLSLCGGKRTFWRPSLYNVFLEYRTSFLIDCR